MSRIGTFADDDLAGWILKSPDLGGALSRFSQAVYTKNRLPLRTRELARTVIAHNNECVVCVNTRDADGPNSRTGSPPTTSRCAKTKTSGAAAPSTCPTSCSPTWPCHAHSGSGWEGSCGHWISARPAN
jgi:hypothetical protein